MLLPVVLLAGVLATGQPGAGRGATSGQTPDDRKETEPLVCEVLKHAAEYVGQQFTFRGTVTSYEHGMYFLPDPVCAEAAAIRVADFPPDDYRRAGGTKGAGILATVHGKIVLRDIPQYRQREGGPGKETVFSVSRVSDAKAVRPARSR